MTSTLPSEDFMPSVFEDPVKMLRQLKGAPLAVLLACYWARQRVSADWLVTVTGYTDKPVTQALKLLSAYGYLTKGAGGWQIAGGVQLPLSPVEISESEFFRPSSSSSDKEVTLICIEDEEQNRKNSDFLANFRELKAWGIREPALSRLAALKHATPEFIRAHVQKLREEKGNLGTAIYRIENNWEVFISEVEDKKEADFCRVCWRVECICGGDE